MSSPKSSQITLDLPNDVILDLSLHVKSGSRINYYNPLMSSSVSMLLTFGDDVVSRSTTLCIQQFLHVKSDSKVHYNVLRSSPVSKLLTFVDNVVSSAIAALVTFSI